MKFQLEKEDSISIFKNEEWYDYTRVKGFSIVGLYTDFRIYPFHAGLFYGVGYNNGNRYLFLKERKYYKYAVWCEWLRLKLPYKVGKKLFKI